MSVMDKIKAFFSGGSTEDAHDHDHDDSHDHEHEHVEPTPEEVAAAMQAEPPTKTVEGLSEDEPRDEVH